MQSGENVKYRQSVNMQITGKPSKTLKIHKNKTSRNMEILYIF